MDSRKINENKILNDLTIIFKQKMEKSESQDDLKIFISNCAKISAFLMDEKAVAKYLIKLNTLLQKKIGNTASPKVNLLRSLLEDELGKFGFHPLFAKATAGLSPTEFRTVLRDKFILKDITLDGRSNHGEFSHAIQWLLICWEKKENASFLSKEVSDVFKEFGENKAVYTSESEKEKSMWDLIVDRLGANDFRSPEHLKIYMKWTQNPELTSLKDLLILRTMKRADQSFNSWFEIHTDDGINGKHTIFKKNEKIENVLHPVQRRNDLSNIVENKETKEIIEEQSDNISNLKKFHNVLINTF